MKKHINIKIIGLFASLIIVMFFSSCKDSDSNADDDTNSPAPSVVSTSPINNATEVARNKTVEVTFSQAMDAATINDQSFIIEQGSTQIIGSVAYAENTATFTANNVFNAEAVFTATITTGAKSASGVALENERVWAFTTGGSAIPLAVVQLGAAGNYVVLAKTAINNSPISAFTGNLGLSPAAESFYTGFSQTAATGFSTSAQITGQMFAADMTAPTPSNLTTAVNDMVTAYNAAAGRAIPDFVSLYSGNLGGKTLSPGLYKWDNSVLMPTDVVISGSAEDVWIFQIAENLTMSSAVNMTLTGGALAKNIFWQVAGEVTIGTTSHFEGIVLSMTGITLNTGASVNGRLLAQTAAIFDSNTVVEPTE